MRIIKRYGPPRRTKFGRVSPSQAIFEPSTDNLAANTSASLANAVSSGTAASDQNPLRAIQKPLTLTAKQQRMLENGTLFDSKPTNGSPSKQANQSRSPSCSRT